MKLINYWINRLIILINILCMGCSANQKLNYRLTNSDLSEESKVLYAFINRASHQIGEKYKMSPCSIGGGINNGSWVMCFGFQRYGSPLDEQKARRLLISSLHDYLDLANKDEEIRPFLKSKPFKAENIVMKIFNYDPKSRLESRDPYVTVVCNTEGLISYFSLSQEDSYKDAWKKYETYDEAIATLEKEKIRNL